MFKCRFSSFHRFYRPMMEALLRFSRTIAVEKMEYLYMAENEVYKFIAIAFHGR